MPAIAIIPARYASVRLPGKPLANQTGKYLIQHVVERVETARSIGRIIVATDDERIRDAVLSFGGEVVMTRADHPSGTDRVAEVAAGLDCDIVVNVQGDEPEIEPDALDTLVGLLESSDAPMATLACPFAGIEADPTDPACVKVAVSENRAVYFSRSVVPYRRTDASESAGPYLHLGVYAFRREFLFEFAAMTPTPLERIEALEQLRAVEHGVPIAVAVVNRAAAGIDTPADYAAFVKRYQSTPAEVVR